MKFNPFILIIRLGKYLQDEFAVLRTKTCSVKAACGPYLVLMAQQTGKKGF